MSLPDVPAAAELQVWLRQAFPPPEEAETRCFLSSIFMDWLSAQDSLDTEETPTSVLLLGLVPLDRGMRVELLLGWASEHGWQEETPPLFFSLILNKI